METIQDIRQRHQKEIEEFQKNCQHPDSFWALEEWALCHFTDYKVRLCTRCESALERQKLPKNWYNDVQAALENIDTRIG